MAADEPKEIMSSYQEDEYAPDNWQALAKQTGVNEPVAEVESEALQQEEQAQGQEVASTQESEVPDKEYNFRALRESIAEQKAERDAERRRYEQELGRMQYQIEQMSRSSQPEVTRSHLDDKEDSDLMTIRDFRRAQQELSEKHQQELQALKYESLENRARLQHSDYNEVMEKYSIPFLRENRDFALAFQASENPAEFAYQLGRMQMGTQSIPQPAQETQARENAERIVQNARKPGTLSSARGGQPSLSKADYYASMSDSDFAKFVQRNLEQV